MVVLTKCLDIGEIDTTLRARRLLHTSRWGRALMIARRRITSILIPGVLEGVLGPAELVRFATVASETMLVSLHQLDSNKFK